MANIFSWIGMREERKVLSQVREHVQSVLKVVSLLHEGLKACRQGDKARVDAIHEELGANEHHADEIRRQLLTQLSQGMMLPPDRDDLVHLIERIDDIADFAQGASRVLVLFDGVCDPEINDDLIGFAAVLVKATETLGETLVSLYKDTAEATLAKCTEVEELEEECDRRKAALLRKVFSMENISPARLIMLHDLIESMESTADKAEDSADVVRNLAVKLRK